MIEYAEQQFELRVPLREGGTVGDSYALYERLHKKKHPNLKDAEAPWFLLYLMNWFWELNNGRPVTMGGLLPIPNVEFIAWLQLQGAKVHRWEIEALRMLDLAFLKVMSSNGSTSASGELLSD